MSPSSGATSGRALAPSDAEYFLGTIVLTVGERGRLTIIDGQQRLATTSILLAAIRDVYTELGHPKRAAIIQTKLLSETDLDTEEEIPKLVLNEDDDTFFRSTVVEAGALP